MRIDGKTKPIDQKIDSIALLRADHYNDEEFYNELISELGEENIGKVVVRVHGEKGVENTTLSKFLKERHINHKNLQIA